VTAEAHIAPQLERIASLLALTLVRDLEEAEQIRVLDAIGYQAAEIAQFLNKKPNTVSAALYRQRHPSPKKKTASRRKTSRRKTSRREPTGGR
jgi:IS30 family transposase